MLLGLDNAFLFAEDNGLGFLVLLIEFARGVIVDGFAYFKKLE